MRKKRVGILVTVIGILLSHLLFTAVQMMTYLYIQEQIVQHILHISVFALFIRFYSLRPAVIAIGVLLLISTIISLTDLGALNQERAAIITSVAIGGILGYFWRIKQWKVVLPLLGVSIASVLAYDRLVYSVPIYDTSAKFELSILEKNRKFLIGHKGEHPSFHQDTVYLVNFSFLNCMPCHVKKKHLPRVIEHFKDRAFKVVEIHIFEDKKIFDKEYMLDYPYVYHDSLDRISKLFKVQGGPEEIIFDKKGVSVRHYKGFTGDASKKYIEETKNLVNGLLLGQ